MGRFEMTRDEERKLERLLHEEDLRRLKIAGQAAGSPGGVVPDTTLAELVLSVRAYNCLDGGIQNCGGHPRCFRRRFDAKDVLKMSRTWGSPEALVSAWPR
jgi:hypothetical protein